MWPCRLFDRLVKQPRGHSAEQVARLLEAAGLPISDSGEQERAACAPALRIRGLTPSIDGETRVPHKAPMMSSIPAHRTARQRHLDRCFVHRELRVSALTVIVTRGGTTTGSQRCQTRRNRESNAQKASASAWCRSPCAMRHRNIFSINRCTSKLTGVASGPISFRGSQISR